MSKKPVLLCIMDGFGWTPNETYGNAVAAANKPFIDSLMAKYPMTTIDASGMAVGLPDGQMGNSEVGHTNMGAGRIVYQQLTLITKSIRDGEMLKNPVLVKNMKAAIDAGKAIHLMGLVGTGGVHSHADHWFGVLEMAKHMGAKEVYLHCITDGRDTDPHSGKGFLADLQAKLDELGIPYIADSQHLENHPLGRVEWVKLVGALLDMEAEADAYFDEEVQRVNAVAESVAGESEHPSILQTYIFKGTVYVRNGGDYVNKMLELAGGTYPFAELEPDQGGNTKMTVEEFYQGAVDADILIYDNTSDVSVSTVADILANGDYLGDMKAIQEGNVWGIQKNYWQSADDVATMIEDLATIIYHPENADQLHYFYKLPAE